VWFSTLCLNIALLKIKRMNSFIPNTLFFIVMLLSITASAQNYQTFQSSAVNYYRENNEGFILASQIDSSDFIAGDSIFHPFTSFRFGGPGDLIETPGWMGKKIIITNDGVNLFFNQEMDTIFIDTQAGLGDSFTFYKYPDGTTVEATVSEISEELIFDILDSVKTYVLTSDNPSFDFDSPSFRIGKSAGLLDMYPFYSFPQLYEPIYGPITVAEKYEIVGQLYPRKGITKPTFFDMNDMEVGDVVQSYSYHTANNYNKRFTILSKSIIHPDTIEYEIERYQNHHFDGISEEFPSFDSLSTVIFDQTLPISDDYVTEQLIPEKDYGEGIGDYTFSLYYNEPCGYHEEFKSWGSYREEGDSIGVIFEPVITSKLIYSNSFGPYSTYYHNTGTDILDYGGVFKSSKIGGTICGEGIFLKVNKETDSKDIVIYPNPTKGNFAIDISGSFDLEIYTIDGRQIYAKTNLTSPNSIDANTLPNGTYFIIISQNGHVYNGKIVISK
jgi:hypothetical protein